MFFLFCAENTETPFADKHIIYSAIKLWIMCAQGRENIRVWKSLSTTRKLGLHYKHINQWSHSVLTRWRCFTQKCRLRNVTGQMSVKCPRSGRDLERSGNYWKFIRWKCEKEDNYILEFLCFKIHENICNL